MIGGPVQQPTSGNNLDWSTYYGSPGMQYDGIITSNENNIIYHAMQENSGLFPSLPGQGAQQTQYNSYEDWYISKFNANGHREWATYYGGQLLDLATSIKESSPGSATSGYVWVAGWTRSTDLSLGSVSGTFKQTFNGGGLGNEDGLIASFNKSNGSLYYATYFGGNGSDRISDMCIDNVDNTLFLVGTADYNYPGTFGGSCNSLLPGQFPICSGSGNRYFQAVPNQTGLTVEGFIAELGLDNLTLEWSTFFGGYHEDYPLSVWKVHHASDNGINSLYVGGYTRSFSEGDVSYPSPITQPANDYFPLADPGNGAFFQYSNSPNAVDRDHGPTQYFLAEFNADYQLKWNTFFGTGAGVTSIASNSQNDIYIMGTGANAILSVPSSPNPNPDAKIPTYDNGVSYFPNIPFFNSNHLLIAKFDVDHKLKWSTLLKGTANQGHVCVDDNDKVFVSGVAATGSSVFYVSQGYWQPNNASDGLNDVDKTDTWIARFNADEQPTWGTYFGGALVNYTQDATSDDVVTNMTVAGHKYLFITGRTRCPNSPYNECPNNTAYCDQTYNTGMDVFISRFTIDNLPDVPNAISEVKTEDEQNLLNVFPNPTNRLFNVTYINNGNTNRYATMNISDIMGRLIKTTSFKLNAGQNNFKIDMDGYTAGIYFVQIINNGIKSSAKLEKL